MNENQLEIIGVRIADKAENILALEFIPQDMLVDAMRVALEEIMRDVRALYVEISGDNPWED